MKYKAPFYGCAYYPESWPKEQVKEDIALMKEVGMNVMRIGEFAWSNMEPSEGNYDFSFMDHVINELDKESIATIMGTPTCTPPAWLSHKHPEIMIMSSHGVRDIHGARRHACPNNPVYREYTRKIVTQMAKHFKDQEAIVGWQIDNELYILGNDGRGCCCDDCYNKFIEYLKGKYETLENLNKSWGLYVWSINYSEWDQIPLPRSNSWQHPSFLTEWMFFQARSYKEYSDFQADILHEYLPKDVPVGTDMMPMLGLDYEDVHEKLDYVQFNHYRSSSNLWDIAFWANYMYNLLDKPFTIMETATCWGGGVAPSWHNDENFCLANSLLPIALGADANCYWLWRNHFAGQELMHGSVVNSHGKFMHIIDEVKEVRKTIFEGEDMINNTYPVKSDIAMHISHHADLTFMFQPMLNGFNYMQASLEHVFKPLLEAGLRPSVISEGLDLSAYKVLISSYLPHMERKDLVNRALEWVKEGGTWIVGPMTDIRTYEATKYLGKPFGHLDEITGVDLAFTLPDGKDFTAISRDGKQIAFRNRMTMLDALLIAEEKTLYRYREGYLKDYAAITETKLGKGRIVQLGAMPITSDFVGLVSSYLDKKKTYDASGNMLIQLRKDKETNADSYLACVEIMNREGYFIASADCSDIVTKEKYSKGQKISFAPFTARFLKI